jgi:hypothetical protein
MLVSEMIRYRVGVKSFYNFSLPNVKQVYLAERTSKTDQAPQGAPGS